MPESPYRVLALCTHPAQDTSPIFRRRAQLAQLDAMTLVSRDGKNWKKSVKARLWPWLYRLADQVIVPSSGSQDLMASLGIRRSA